MNSSEFLRLYEESLIRYEAETWAAIMEKERGGFWKRSVTAIRSLFLQDKNRP
jgi:hypothetical protein